MFKDRFFLIVVSLAALLVTLAVSQPFSKTVDLSQPPRPIIVPRTGTDDLSRSREAEMARWQAMAEYYQNLEEVQPIERSRAAETARWEAMAEYYQNVEEAQNLERSRIADAARWTAIAEYYL